MTVQIELIKEIKELKEKAMEILLEALELIDCTSLNSWKGDCKCPSCKFLNKVKEYKDIFEGE